MFWRMHKNKPDYSRSKYQFLFGGFRSAFLFLSYFVQIDTIPIERLQQYANLSEWLKAELSHISSQR